MKNRLRAEKQYKWGMYEYLYAAGVFVWLYAFISMLNYIFAIIPLIVAGTCAALLNREILYKSGEWNYED